jgi:hypothetical protein
MPPIVSALISSGFSILANAVTSKGKEYVEEKLGVNLEESLATTEGKFKLRQLELDHEEFLVNSFISEKQLDLADIANARDAQVKIQESEHAGWLAKNIVPMLALTVIFGGGTMIHLTNEPDVRMALFGAITMVLGFYFGSSKSSQLKDTTISNITSK